MSLTKNERPFGLLTPAEQQVMRTWPHGWEYFGLDGWTAIQSPPWHNSTITYRTIPAPKVTEHVRVLRLYPGGADFGPVYMDTHRITIRHLGKTLPTGSYTGLGGAQIIVEALCDDED